MELKIFKMNEYDWVIAKTKEQALNWYNMEFGASGLEDAIHEVNYKSEDSGFWAEASLKDFDVPKIGMFKNWNGVFCQWIWFRDIVKDWDLDVPAIIASTEF